MVVVVTSGVGSVVEDPVGASVVVVDEVVVVGLSVVVVDEDVVVSGTGVVVVVGTSRQ
jgi:hypothetical protein